jgi:hypothetical protein
VIDTVEGKTIFVKKNSVGSEIIHGRIHVILHFHLHGAEIDRIRNLGSVSVRTLRPKLPDRCPEAPTCLSPTNMVQGIGDCFSLKFGDSSLNFLRFGTGCGGRSRTGKCLE